MQQKQSVMRSVVKCLVSSILLLFTIPALSQEPEYIIGIGAVIDQDGILDTRKSIQMSFDDLSVKVLEYCGYQVSSHTTVRNNNGKEDYHSVIASDKGALIPWEEVEFVHMDGSWIARIEKSRVKEQEVKWIEQNVTINNTYNETPRYLRGYEYKTSTTRTTRRTDVIGPSGNVVKSTPGRGQTQIVRSRWNGRYGHTWKSTKIDP